MSARCDVAICDLAVCDVEPTGEILYVLEVDWDGDGVFDGSNEAFYLEKWGTERGRDRYINPDGGLEFVTVGRLRLKLNNRSRRFDEFYADGPLYGLLNEGAFVRFGTFLAGDSAPRWRFSGKVAEILPSGGLNESVELVVLDGIAQLSSEVNIAVQADIRVDEAMDLVLDNLAWPTLWGRDLEVTSDFIPYYWANQYGSTALADLVKSALGYFCTRGDGTAKFISRNTVAGATVTLTDLTTLKDVSIARRQDNYYNVVKVRYYPRREEATASLWELLEAPGLMDGETWVSFADYTFNNQAVPALSIVTPVATTDYTANTAQDGSGTDKTADVSVTVTHFGETAKIEVTNNSGGTVYITFLRVRGVAITAPYPGSYVAEREDYATAPKTFVLDLPWQQSTGAAVSLATAFADFLAARRPWPTVKIEGRPEIQFGADLFDTIWYDADFSGIEQSFRVGKIIEESQGETCQRVRSTWKLEPYLIGESYWTWDIQNFGVDTIFGI
jgi:hypothetical protein